MFCSKMEEKEDSKMQGSSSLMAQFLSTTARFLLSKLLGMKIPNKVVIKAPKILIICTIIFSFIKYTIPCYCYII